ncbi:MAG: hypothetical protein J5682_07090 [Prevotella sp.]|nr:hypothetical protein [Prevotella sp.]
MDRKQIIKACAGCLLAGITATGFIGWLSEHKKVEGLQAQMEEMKKLEMRSAVARSVSAQMEDIANEQREISDEKREEALQQTRVANEMRLRSERERMNALEAERSAVASEKKALDASSVAEKQRNLAEQQRALAEEQQQLAEHQRIQAEFSKRKADTLSYIALGRSLGSISTIQANANHYDIANLLGYASYLYTSRYRGDVYHPAVFQSLMHLSQSIVSWTEHAGAVMNIEYMPGKDNTIVSVSNYGEIILSERQGNRLLSKVVFKNNKYDFRDVIVERTSGNIYAVSRTGHLVIVSKDLQNIKTIVLEDVEHPMRLHDLNDKSMLVIGERALALIDLKLLTVSNTRQLPFRVNLGSRKENLPLLFDDQGLMHLVKDIDNYDTKKVPVAGKVTAYCESKNTGVEAYGMSDGTIWLIDKTGRMQNLVGHRSRISKMKINGRRLYSASYDGTMNLWITDKEKVELMTLIETSNWIMHFNYDSKKNTFWVGDVKGNLTAVNISVPFMVETIRKKLRRNLTNEEWNYYIGQDVPYETFVDTQGKEVAP